MQKDMKIGLFVGLALAGAVILYIGTRPAFSPRERILRQNRAKEYQAQPQSAIEQPPWESFSVNQDYTSVNTPVTTQEQTTQRITAERESANEAPADDRYVQKEYKTRKFYIVREGDTLSKISKKYYGSSNKWYGIYEANRDVLDSPNKIKPGMKLYIPDR